MSLVRWNPWQEMDAMHNEMNRLFSRFSGMGGFNSGEGHIERQSGTNGDVNSGQWLLPMDVLETPEALQLRTSLPGVDPQDVHIEVKDNVLTVSAQRRWEDQRAQGSHRWIEQQYGSFVRSVTLPRSADTEKIEARSYNGVLELTVPKRESAKPRRIELKIEAPQAKAIEQPNGSEQPRIFESRAQLGVEQRSPQAAPQQPVELVEAADAEPSTS